MVGLLRSDELHLLGTHLGVRGGLGFPEDLPHDRHVPSLVTCEVGGDEIGIWGSEVGDRVGEITADVRLPVRPCDLVDDLRGVIADSVDGLTPTIALKSRRSPLGPSYEAGTVFAKEYVAGGLPEPTELRDDALRMATLLGRVYEAEDTDPRAPGPPPEVTAVVEASALAAGKAPKATSAGFRPNAAQRKAIELRGMEVAEVALHEWGWTSVTNTSAAKPYDFHCQAGDDELYVEVKATAADGSSVILTRNEVDHVRANYPQTALAIVANVTPPFDEGSEATGGDLSIIYPWTIADSRLSVISYVYETPAEEAESW